MNLPNLHSIRYEEPYAPDPLPKGWTEKLFTHGLNEPYYEHKSGLIVMCSLSTMDDGNKWIHVSCSRRGRKPSWADMYGAKRVFIGDDKEAFQIFPKNEDLVDMANCYHLWALHNSSC